MSLEHKVRRIIKRTPVDGAGNSVGFDKNLGGSVLIDWAEVTISAVTPGWTVSIDGANTYAGFPVLAVTATAGAADTLTATLTLPSVYLGGSKRLVIPVSTADSGVSGNAVNYVQIWTPGGTNRFWTFAYASHCPGEWTEGVVIAGDAIGSGHIGNSNWTEIAGTSYTNLQLVITKASGKSVTKIGVGPVLADPTRAPKAVITLFMDGIYSGQYTYARPILQQYGMTASLAIIRSRIGNGNYLKLPQLQKMYAGGHELIHHSGLGAEVGWDNTTKYPDGQEYELVKADIAGNQAWFAANGFSRGIGYGVMAYTNGLVNTQPLVRRTNIANAIKDAGLKKVRQLSPYQASYYGQSGVSNTIVTPSQLIGSTEDLTSVSTLIDKIIARGGWSALTFHDIVLSSAVGNDVTVATFQSVCQYLATKVKDGSIVVLNFSDAMRLMDGIAAPT